MWEYLFLVELPSTIQRTLNQWRHDYDLEILQMNVSISGHTILLIRRKKIEL